jgi:hypothetical protein
MCVSVRTYVYMFVFKYVFVYLCTYVCICVPMYVCMYVYVCMCVYVIVCVCVYVCVCFHALQYLGGPGFESETSHYGGGVQTTRSHCWMKFGTRSRMIQMTWLVSKLQGK